MNEIVPKAGAKLLSLADLNSKHEIRNSKESQMTHFKMSETRKGAVNLDFGNSDLFRISIFGFRILFQLRLFSFGYAGLGSESGDDSPPADSPSCNSRRRKASGQRPSGRRSIMATRAAP